MYIEMAIRHTPKAPEGRQVYSNSSNQKMALSPILKQAIRIGYRHIVACLIRLETHEYIGSLFSLITRIHHFTKVLKF